MKKNTFLGWIILSICFLSVAFIFLLKNYLTKTKNSAPSEPVFISIEKPKILKGPFLPSDVSSTLKFFLWDRQKAELVEQNDLDYLTKNSPKNSATTSFSANSTETYVLKNGRLTITQTSSTLWQSPKNWWVDHFFIADSDGDGNQNLNLSVWKEGNFAENLPFWVKKNNPSIKNHFFVFTVTEHGVYPLWQSSNLERPNCEFLFANLTENKTPELVVIEGAYQKDSGCSGKYLAVWKWNQWGFVNEWRSPEGRYKNLQTKKINQKIYLTTEEF